MNAETTIRQKLHDFIDALSDYNLEIETNLTAEEHAEDSGPALGVRLTPKAVGADTRINWFVSGGRRKSIARNFDRISSISSISPLYFLEQEEPGEYIKAASGKWRRYIVQEIEKGTETVQHDGEYVLTTDGERDFGEISLETARQIRRRAGKIRLRIGEQVGKPGDYG